MYHGCVLSKIAQRVCGEGKSVCLMIEAKLHAGVSASLHARGDCWPLINRCVSQEGREYEREGWRREKEMEADSTLFHKKEDFKRCVLLPWQYLSRIHKCS